MVYDVLSNRNIILYQCEFIGLNMNMIGLDREVLGSYSFTGIPMPTIDVYQAPPGGEPVPIPAPPFDEKHRGLSGEYEVDPWGNLVGEGGRDYTGPHPGSEAQDPLGPGHNWDVLQEHDPTHAGHPHVNPTGTTGTAMTTPPDTTVTPMDGGIHLGTHNEGKEVIEENDTVKESDPTWLQYIFGFHWWGPANSIETSPDAAYKYASDHQDSLKIQMDYAGYEHDLGVENVSKEYASGAISRDQAVELLSANDERFINKIDALYYHRESYRDGNDITPYLMKHISRMVMSPIGQQWQRSYLKNHSTMRGAQMPKISPPRKRTAVMPEGVSYSYGPAPYRPRPSAVVTSPVSKPKSKAFVSRVAKERYMRRFRDTSEWSMPVSPIAGQKRKRYVTPSRGGLLYHNPVIIYTRKRKRKRVRFNL